MIEHLALPGTDARDCFTRFGRYKLIIDEEAAGLRIFDAIGGGQTDKEIRHDETEPRESCSFAQKSCHRKNLKGSRERRYHAPQANKRG